MAKQIPGGKKRKMEAKVSKKKLQAATKKKKGKVAQKQEWFIVNTYSGYEQKVSTQLKARIKANRLGKKIAEIFVPMQDKIVLAKGKKKTIKEKIFPGYLLIKMTLTDDTQRLVKHTDGIIGFVGASNAPTPLTEEELKSIMAFTKVKQPTFQTSFTVGDAVKVVEGPFKEFVGSIDEINQDKGQIKVLLSVFGRETPVELEFLQVKKI